LTVEDNIPEGVGADIINQCIMFNSSARIEKDATGQRKVLGNVTECGLINYLISRNILDESLVHKRDEDVTLCIPFSSRRKRATTVRPNPSNKDQVRIYCKGAPELVI